VKWLIDLIAERRRLRRDLQVLQFSIDEILIQTTETRALAHSTCRKLKRIEQALAADTEIKPEDIEPV
jgi:hypothetical protein